MKLQFNKQSSLEFLKVFLLGILISIGTFPGNDWSFSKGIDPSLKWVFSYIATSDLSLGKEIIFPHGPLAFFMYPLEETIVLTNIVTVLLKLILVFNIYFLLKGIKQEYKWLLTFLAAYFILIFAGFNHILLACLLALYSNYYHSEKPLFKYLAFFLTTFAFYVKSYVAIITGILAVSFILYYFFKEKNIKKAGKDGIILLLMLWFFWLTLYGTPFGFLEYIYGVIQLVFGNSSSAAYYPHNNWWALSFFMLALIAIPFISRNAKSVFYSALVGLSLFAAWKHGMAREDASHVKGLLNYLMIALVVYGLFDQKKLFQKLILGVLAVFLFTSNMPNAKNYYASKFSLIRVDNFTDFVFNFSKLKKENQKRIQQNLASNRLPKAILDTIGNSTVDIYPWDYSIIPANDLNWQPRVVIQSYAGYSSWLDRQNADHFDSPNAPEFIIWDLKKIPQDINGSDFSSIDRRYLLNDEPQTMVQFIRNYRFFYQTDQFLILKRRLQPISVIESTISSQKTTFGNWYEVPARTGDLVRIKVSFKNSFIQQMKSFFYKDEQFWIYLQLENGLIHKYRIVPKNAKDGLWINPYLFNTGEWHRIDRIMLKCSNQSIVNTTVTLQWESLQFGSPETNVLEMFNIKSTAHDTLLFEASNSYESLDCKKDSIVYSGQGSYPPACKYWNPLSEENIHYDSYSGERSQKIKPKGFSSSFSLPLDSLSKGTLKLVADCWVKSNNYDCSGSVSMILAVEEEKGNVFWEGQQIDPQIIDREQWNHIHLSTNFDFNRSNQTLKAFLWNKSNQEIIVDDFRVMIFHARE